MSRKTNTWDPNMVTAIAALLVGVCALVISIVQTNLQRKQSYAAAWPYLEIGTDMLDNKFYFRITNKGAGPAIVKKVRLSYHSKEYTSIVKLAREITGTQDTFLAHYWDRLDKRVIAPQETIEYLILPNWADAERFNAARDSIQLRVAYASVYDQLWIAALNKEVQEIKRLNEFDAIQ